MDLDTLLGYAQYVRMVNRCLDGLALPVSTEPSIAGYIKSIRELASAIALKSDGMTNQITNALNQMRPLTV